MLSNAYDIRKKQYEQSYIYFSPMMSMEEKEKLIHQMKILPLLDFFIFMLISSIQLLFHFVNKPI